jgi:hypothetical protein
MNEQELRKHILNGNKTERINFAVTPEMKEAVSKMAEEECITVSALLTSRIMDAILENKGLFDDKARG